MMTRRLAAVHGQRARRRDPGRRASSASATATAVAPTPRDRSTPLEYTRAGNLTTNSRGFPHHPAGPVRDRLERVADGATGDTARTTAPAPPTTYIYDPAGLDQRSRSAQDGSVTYTDQNSASPTYQQRVTAGYLSLATFPNEAGLQRDGGSLWSVDRSLRRRDRRHPGTAGFGHDDLRRARACRTSTWPPSSRT